jgi:conjugative relaxase-like TrwC/TraI family protein
MTVRHPVSGEMLRQAGAGGGSVSALDATFSAPKSVSAVWALGTPELRSAIESVHEWAIDGALHHSLEYVAMCRERLSGGAVLHTRAMELVATSWRHTTARAVADQAPDPQLHSHVLLHGAVRRDGRLVAIDSRAWLVHRRARAGSVGVRDRPWPRPRRAVFRDRWCPAGADRQVVKPQPSGP